MGIALFGFGALFAPLQGLASWFMGPGPVPARAIAIKSIAHCARPMRTAGQNYSKLAVRRPLRVLPLRVLRVADGCGTPSSAGRMVISGRMADVCAELDRLAALESTAH